MSKKCTSCQKKFAVWNINRIKCMECDQGFCQQCIRKGNGVKLYCNICLILNTRPVDRNIIKDIRTKDVKLYLERRNVKTDSCLEKEDLVNRFVWYVSREPTLPNRNKVKTNLLNGFISAFTNSMPNLSEQNFTRRENVTSHNNFPTNVSEQPSSSRVPRNSQSTNSQTTQQENVPPRQQNISPPQEQHYTPPHQNSTPPHQNSTSPQQNYPSPQDYSPTAQPAASNNTNIPAHNTRNETNNKPPQRKLIRLTDIENVEDIPNLSVKQLKELLFINRIDFKGCVEKEELIKKAIALWIETRTVGETDNMSGEDLCKICMDAPLNSVLLECGHIATCIDCGKQLAECPICRQYVVRVVHTFKA